MGGLADGRAYRVQVATVGWAGSSSLSAPIAVTPGGTAGAPTSVSASAGNGQASLSWTAPASWAGASYHYYRVLVDGVANQVVGGSLNGALVAGLTNGRTYTVQVQACADQWCYDAANPTWASAAASPRSTPAVVSPSAALPAAPTSVVAQKGPGSFSASWAAVAGATGYRTYVDGALVAETAFQGAYVSGLADGRAYQVSVAAVNGAGVGAASAPVTVTPGGSSGAPTALAAAAGNGQVSLSWAAPSSWAGATYRYYRVLVNGAANQVVSGAYTGALVTGLSNGQTYNVQVQACSGNSWCADPVNGAWSAPESSPRTAALAVTPTTAVPTAPTGLALQKGPGSFSAAWSAVAGATGYRVYINGEHVGSALVPAFFASGLTDGQAYQVRVAAIGGFGVSALSAPLNVTPGGTAAAPTGLFAAAGSGQVSLSWAAPSSWAGATSHYYQVLVNGAPNKVIGAATPSTTVTGLTNGQSYFFQVQACADTWCSIAGNSPWSSAAGSPRSAPVGAIPGS